MSEMLYESALREWLSRQSICVTGGGGSLGRKLVQRLLTGGVKRVAAFSRRSVPEKNDPINHQNIRHIVGDILNHKDTERALRGCTTVFHLAALTHAGNSKLKPLRYFEVNSFGTAQLLETCRRLGIQRTIYVSTSHVYGIPYRLPVDEDHPTVPLSIYAASKLAGEKVVHGYAGAFGLSCDIVRVANIYGASINTETVIGRALKQTVNGGPIHLRSLTATRDFIHADDVVEALLRIAAATNEESACRTINVSTGQGVSVREVAETLSEIAVDYELGRPEVIGEGACDELIPKFFLNNRRLSELTGWLPQIKLEHGLRLALQEFLMQRH